ncbi:pyridoxamine 5'-phosphate oxidase family protein [Streptomyces sp. YKOK-J1]
MSQATAELPLSTRAFLTRPYPATFTTLRRDGTPHVTPVRFAFVASARLAQVTTRAKARKARNVAAGWPGGHQQARQDGRREGVEALLRTGPTLDAWPPVPCSDKVPTRRI